MSGIRGRLVALSLAVLAVVSFAFTFAHNLIATAWIDQDLQRQAVTFGREISATIGSRSEFDNGLLLRGDIRRIMDVRDDILHMEILQFTPAGARIVASSDDGARLPFGREEGVLIRKGRVVSKLVRGDTFRSWITMVPIRIDGAVAGALSTRFSLNSADWLLRRIRWSALVLTAVSVGVMGLLVALVVTVTVNRPIAAFFGAIDRIREGEHGVRVTPGGAHEFTVLARQFNDMLAQMERFNDEVSRRIEVATRELDGRFQEVQRLNELLYRTRRSLSHAERLAVAGEMVAEVAHEVGTPLHSIAGHLELLRADLAAGSANGRAGHRLDIIEDQLARVTAIIHQLLDLSRRDRPPPAPVNLLALVRDSMDLMRPGLSGTGVCLTAEFEDGLSPVLGDAGQLMQVMLNLLSNAVDATPCGGAITVSAKRGEPGEVCLVVSDTGPGIPAERRQEIFEPFVTTKPAGQGTGLGLFIVAQIVREHGGRIEVDAAAAGGTIRVTLPTVEVRP